MPVRGVSPDCDMDHETNGTKPAAIYLRRSTDRQEKSLEDQRRDIDRYACEHGFAVVAEFTDDGVSGTSGETRKGFLAMLAEARSPERKWDSILVWDIKRFGRMSSDEAGHYRWLFRQAGVEIVYTSEGFTGTSADKFLRFFKQEAARDESATLSKAVIRGMVSLADQGWWPGGMAPYGYDLGYFDQTGRLFQTVRYTDEGEKLILDPEGKPLRTVKLGQKVKASDTEHVRLLPGVTERVEVVRQIFDWYAGGSALGFKAIADRLNRQGVVSPKGRGWALSSIRAMLTNPVYIGQVVWNRRRMGKFHRIADRREVERDGCGRTRLKWNGPQDWIIYEHAHEPLVDQETFERAQRIVQERRDRTLAAGFLSGKGKVSPYLLSGLLRCAACGGSMHGRTTWKSKRGGNGSSRHKSNGGSCGRYKTSYYVCGAAITKGKAICQPILFLKDPLDDFVISLVGIRIAAFLGEHGRSMLRRLVERKLASEARDPGPETAQLKARLEELTNKIDSVIDLAASTPDHRDLLSDRLGRLRSERREIESRLGELDAVPLRVTNPEEIVDVVLKGLSDAQQLFEHGTMEERKRVIRAFVEGITLDAQSQSAELRIKKLPVPQSPCTGNSFDVVAGARYEPPTFSGARKRRKP